MAAFFPVRGRCLCPRAVPAQRWVTGGQLQVLASGPSSLSTGAGHLTEVQSRGRGKAAPSVASGWLLVWRLDLSRLRRQTSWKSGRLYWRGCPGGEPLGERAQADCPAWAARASSAGSPSASGSSPRLRTVFRQDGRQWGGFWEVERRGRPPWPLLELVGWWWLSNSVFFPRTSC